ncbi:hypothetical protein [Photobacterium sp. 53610]|uniref:hypothetical protein n=1 Tax=Photobacterium sp. 53610 TaxID=3102789 RepID=UPI002ED98AF5
MYFYFQKSSKAEALSLSSIELVVCCGDIQWLVSRYKPASLHFILAENAGLQGRNPDIENILDGSSA